MKKAIRFVLLALLAALTTWLSAQGADWLERATAPETEFYP